MHARHFTTFTVRSITHKPQRLYFPSPDMFGLSEMQINGYINIRNS